MAVFTGNGSAASPSLTFSSDTDTGVFRGAANTLSFAVGGVLEADLTSSRFQSYGPIAAQHVLATGYALRAQNWNTAVQQSVYIGHASDASLAYIGTPRYGGGGFMTAVGSNGIAFTNYYGGQIEFHTRATVVDGSTYGKVTDNRMVVTDDYVRLTQYSGGIQFNGDTAAANALDDYEEGTWTPQSTAGVLIDNTGSYIKVGKQSILTYEFRVDPATVTSSIIRILFPYSATSALSVKGVLTYCSANADAAGPYQWTNATATYIDLVKNDGTAVSHAALAGDYFKGFFILG